MSLTIRSPNASSQARTSRAANTGLVDIVDDPDCNLTSGVVIVGVIHLNRTYGCKKSREVFVNGANGLHVGREHQLRAWKVIQKPPCGHQHAVLPAPSGQLHVSTVAPLLLRRMALSPVLFHTYHCSCQYRSVWVLLPLPGWRRTLWPAPSLNVPNR